jgi:hypothetical protein
MEVRSTGTELPLPGLGRGGLDAMPTVGSHGGDGDWRGGGGRRASGVTPGFKAKPNAHSMCVHELSLHTYHTENGYRITNVTIYNIYY